MSDPAAADFGVLLSEPTPDSAPGALDKTIALLADGRLRLRAHKSMPMQRAAEANRQLEKRHRSRAHYPHPRLIRAAARSNRS